METISIKLPKWGITEMTGYEPVTTYWQDFSIAERFGIPSIEDTYKQQFHSKLQPNGRDYLTCFNYDHYCLTELVMVLNWKMWSFYDEKKMDFRSPLGNVYKKLYERAKSFAESRLKGDELNYYYRTTD